MKTTFAWLTVVLLLSGLGCRGSGGDQTGSGSPAGGSAPGAAAQSDRPPAAPQAPVPPPPPVPDEGAASKPSGSKYHEVTLPAGTKLGVRLNGSVDAGTAKVEDAVDATLIQPVVISETEVVPAGAHVKGRVSAVTAAGPASGRPVLALAFTVLDVSGDSYPVSATITEAAPATKGADAAKAGIPAGGDKVAGGKNEAFPKGSVLSLQLSKPVTIRVANK